MKKEGSLEKAGFFKKNYSLSWKYIKESGNHILLVIFLLFLGFFIALIFQPPILIEAVKAFMKSVLIDTSDFNVFEMIIYILNNNLKNSFFAMFFGIIFGVMPIFTALSNGYVLGFVSEIAVLGQGPLVLLRLVPHGIFEFPAIILALATGIKLGFCTFIEPLKKFSKGKTVKISILFILPVLILAFFSLVFYFNSNLIIAGFFIFLLFLYIFAIFLLLFIPTLIFLDLRAAFLNKLENSLRVFLFVVLPLLILAAIIEGFLIIFLR